MNHDIRLNETFDETRIHGEIDENRKRKKTIQPEDVDGVNIHDEPNSSDQIKRTVPLGKKREYQHRSLGTCSLDP